MATSRAVATHQYLSVFPHPHRIVQVRSTVELPQSSTATHLARYSAAWLTLADLLASLVDDVNAVDCTFDKIKHLNYYPFDFNTERHSNHPAQRVRFCLQYIS